MAEELFAKSIKIGGKTYFFTIKHAQAGQKSLFLQITETRVYNGQNYRSSIIIFADQVGEFVKMFDEAKANIESLRVVNHV